MSQNNILLLSVVVPLYNEADGLDNFNSQLLPVLEKVAGRSFEVLYCDDGSQDTTPDIVQKLHKGDSRIKLVRLSRNFGKENALAAGISASSGRSVLMIDGDGQHPVNLIPSFVEAWQKGAQVVVGVRKQNTESVFRRLRSKLFYGLFNKLTGQHLQSGATDYRLIDKVVRDAFVELHESDRITRGLIDWLGFKRTYITYTQLPRLVGSPAYSTRQLFKLAANSFVSLSPKPLYLFGYLGVGITTFSFALGTAIIIEQLLMHDPLSWNFTGTAMLSILLVFLVGLLLTAQGMLSLYITHIHTQTKGRPLYVIDPTVSVGIKAVPEIE